MFEEEEPVEVESPWGIKAGQQALAQTAGIVGSKYAMGVAVATSGESFEAHLKGAMRSGVLSAYGSLVENHVVLRIELLNAPAGSRIPVESVIAHLSDLNEKCRVLKPEVDRDAGTVRLFVELRLEAKPLSLGRESAFASELEKLDKFACSLQRELPRPATSADLAKLYRGLDSYLAPIVPWTEEDLGPDYSEWASETVNLLLGNCSVGLRAELPVQGEFALAMLGAKAAESSLTLGRAVGLAIHVKELQELVHKAPGIVVVQASMLRSNTSRYDLEGEVISLLSALSANGHSVIFWGTMSDLQSSLGGGQGGRNDPILPILRHAPEAPFPILARFAVRSAGATDGGLSKKAEDELVEVVSKGLAALDSAKQLRVLPVVAARMVRAWRQGGKIDERLAAEFVSKVGGVSETLAGLNLRPRGVRNPEVQCRYTEVLGNPHLEGSLREHLLGQDQALADLTGRLRTECLTRPPHQPLRYCAQGTPGTGKSESAVLIASQLKIPYVNIDAASMPDYYTAAAQLLGSGRGIVGSYEAGRLEQAAKHHTGALVEVSDLDHARPEVRAALADLFLQILETGEGQSATGAMFSCANLIFAFTMNLPNGLDESIRMRVGFGGPPSLRSIGAAVADEIKHALSSAFLSRVGLPVLFEPLKGAALGAIVERAMKQAALSAADRLHFKIGSVSFEEGLGEQVIDAMQTGIVSCGARSILDYGRRLAADAIMDLCRSGSGFGDGDICFYVETNGTVRIKTVNRHKECERVQ